MSVIPLALGQVHVRDVGGAASQVPLRLGLELLIDGDLLLLERIAPLDKAERGEGRDDAQDDPRDRGDRARAKAALARPIANGLVDEFDRLGVEVVAAGLEQLTGLGERLALVEQEIVVASLPTPAFSGGRDAGAGTQELAVLFQEVLEPRPVREQCLVRDAGDRLHPVVAVGHEQPRIDQDVEQPPADGIDRGAAPAARGATRPARGPPHRR